MAIASVVTEGYGPGASIALVVTAGYGVGAAPQAHAPFFPAGGAPYQRAFLERQRARWERGEREDEEQREQLSEPQAGWEIAEDAAPGGLTAKDLIEGGLGPAEAARAREALARHAARLRREMDEQDDEEILLLMA